MAYGYLDLDRVLMPLLDELMGPAGRQFLGYALEYLPPLDSYCMNAAFTSFQPHGSGSHAVWSGAGGPG